jgi:hypothetical protein
MKVSWMDKQILKKLLPAQSGDHWKERRGSWRLEHSRLSHNNRLVYPEQRNDPNKTARSSTDLKLSVNAGPTAARHSDHAGHRVGRVSSARSRVGDRAQQHRGALSVKKRLEMCVQREARGCTREDKIRDEERVRVDLA